MTKFTANDFVLWFAQNPDAADDVLAIQIMRLPEDEKERLRRCIRILEDAAEGDSFDKLKSAVDGGE